MKHYFQGFSLIISLPKELISVGETFMSKNTRSQRSIRKDSAQEKQPRISEVQSLVLKKINHPRTKVLSQAYSDSTLSDTENSALFPLTDGHIQCFFHYLK